MNFPKSLYQRDRQKLNDKKIKNHHYLYMRNKPGYSWKVEDGIPDFNTIKVDQSFNWCLFSIPIWARFNDKKEYLENYAVTGIKTKTIRLTKEINNKFENFSWTAEHLPIENNYSHCQLKKLNEKLTKDKIRELRLTLKHKSKIYFKPDQKCNLLKMMFHLLRMSIIKIMDQ